MTNRVRGLLAAASLAAALAACGNSGSPRPDQPQVTTPPAPKLEDQFGACFATRYRADPNSKATDPVPCPDLPPVNPAIKPANL